MNRNAWKSASRERFITCDATAGLPLLNGNRKGRAKLPAPSGGHLRGPVGGRFEVASSGST